MPRLMKLKGDQLFADSTRKAEQGLSDAEKDRRARAALTAKLRGERLAKEEAEKIAAEEARAAKNKKKTGKKSAPPPAK